MCWFFVLCFVVVFVGQLAFHFFFSGFNSLTTAICRARLQSKKKLWSVTHNFGFSVVTYYSNCLRAVALSPTTNFELLKSFCKFCGFVFDLFVNFVHLLEYERNSSFNCSFDLDFVFFCRVRHCFFVRYVVGKFRSSAPRTQILTHHQTTTIQRANQSAAGRNRHTNFHDDTCIGPRTKTG